MTAIPAAAQNPPETAPGKLAVSVDIVPTIIGIIAIDDSGDDDKGNDTGYFGMGFQSEYLVVPHFSAGSRIDVYGGRYEGYQSMYFGIAAHARHYPLSTGLDKLYFDAGLGFNMFNFADEEIFKGMSFVIKAGWKARLGRYFYAEPSVGWFWSKTSDYMPGPPPGLQFCLAFGAIFL